MSMEQNPCTLATDKFYLVCLYDILLMEEHCGHHRLVLEAVKGYQLYG